jgi:alpha-tubulin suppressor-like RCC1 family protein
MSSIVPVVVSGLDNAVTVTAGHQKTCAVTGAGTVMCWGAGWGSQPVTVNGLSDVVAVAIGSYYYTPVYNHYCALTRAGAVECWGTNLYGELGDGTTTYRDSPTPVIGLSGPVTAIAAGDEYTCASLEAGGAQCWGSRLGNGTTLSSTSPVTVVNLTGVVPSLTAGLDHACAVTGSGMLKCWGSNLSGELGNGMTNMFAAPVTISGPAGGWASVSAGAAHTCALSHNGEMTCWGGNWDGQVGDGTFSGRSTPARVNGLGQGISISAGWYHSCGVTSVGSAVCWGYNGGGQLGARTSDYQSAIPVTVTGLVSGVMTIAAAWYHSCALMQTGGVKCWGINNEGQLGNATGMDSVEPVDVSGLSDVTAIATTWSHGCALAGTQVKCWGWNEYGQLGDGTQVNRLAPVVVSGLSGVRAIATGDMHTCALINTGSVMCWGGNNYGQLGDGTQTDRLAPTAVHGLTDATAIAAGEVHTCALTRGGTVKCWGTNWDGVLGDGTFTNRLTPVTVQGLNGRAVSITAGMEHTCAVISSGEVQCWGANSSGELGIDPGWTPVSVVGFGFRYFEILPFVYR